MPARTLTKEQLVKVMVDSLLARAVADTARQKNKYFDKAFKAWDSLRALGDEGRDALVPLLRHPHPAVRLTVAQCLLRYQTEEALAVLKKIANDWQFWESDIAKITVDGWNKCHAAGEEYAYLLDPIDEPVAPAEPERVPIKREVMTEKRLTKEQLVQAIEDNLIARSDTDSVRKANRHFNKYHEAWDKLRAMGDEGREALVPLLRHPHPAVRMAAAQCLLRYRTEEALAVLTKIASDWQIGESIIAKIAVDGWRKRQAAGEADTYPLDPLVEPVAPAKPGCVPVKREVMAEKRCLTLAAVAEALDTAGLGAVAPSLVALAQPSIRIWPYATEARKLPVGASKLGGMPDVPPRFMWPKLDSEPLAFLAQLALADVAPYDLAHLLPDRGMLYVFYDGYADRATGDAHGACRVLWWDGDRADLRRRRPPEMLAPECCYAPCALEFSAEITLPAGQSPAVRALGLSDAASQAYWQVLDTISRTQTGYAGDEDDCPPMHRLLGHPAPIQDDIVEELLMDDEMATASPAAWRLLLQLSSDEQAGMQWDDLGRLYFCITQDDLRARRFAGVRMIKQSG